MVSGVPLNSIKNGYLNAKTQQGPGAFSSLVNESLNGLTGNLTTVANSISAGRAPTRSQLQSLTGLPGAYFNKFPGLLKGATGGLSFGLSQRGGWSMDATFSPEKAFDAKYL